MFEQRALAEPPDVLIERVTVVGADAGGLTDSELVGAVEVRGRLALPVPGLAAWVELSTKSLVPSGAVPLEGGPTVPGSDDGAGVPPTCGAEPTTVGEGMAPMAPTGPDDEASADLRTGSRPTPTKAIATKPTTEARVAAASHPMIQGQRRMSTLCSTTRLSGYRPRPKGVLSALAQRVTFTPTGYPDASVRTWRSY